MHSSTGGAARSSRQTGTPSPCSSTPSRIGLPRLTEEREKCRIDLFGVSPRDVVRTTPNGDKGTVGDQRRKPRCNHLERKDAIRHAVPDEHRNVDLRKVSTEVRQPG